MAVAAAPMQQQQPPSLEQAPSRWVPSLPTGLIASLNPFAAAEEPKDVADTQQDGVRQRPGLPVLGHDSGPPSPTKSTGSIMFAEPESQGTSLSGSREGSIDCKRRAKKSNKHKTSYSICHPPPSSSTRQILHRRPRSLLQLHKLSPNSRPLPAYEVIPSTNFSVRLTRATTKIFKGKHTLCPSDLVVLRAEQYHTEESEEDQEDRDVVALICKGRKEEGGATGKAKIYMANGEEWEAYPTLSGGYEFFTTDQHGLGLTVRWVPKKSKKEHARTEPRRFNFSTISQNTRRHPVIANLSASSLAIHDSYKIPIPSMATPQATPSATPKQTATILEDGLDSDDNASPKQETRTTTDQLRSIITMTSLYVAFREGWSPNFKYEDAAAAAPSSRRNSIHTPVSTPPASPHPTPANAEKRASVLSLSSSLFRISSLRSSRSARASTFSPADSSSAANNNAADSPTRSASTKAPAGRARADSSSTVLVNRAASNRRNNNHNNRSSAPWRPDLLSAGRQSEVRETSRETTPVQHLSRQSSMQATPRPSRNASVATGNASRRASVLPDPELEPELESESEVEGSAEPQFVLSPPSRTDGVDGRGPSTSASSSEAGAAGSKPPVVQILPKEKKGRKWKRWLKGKF